MAGRYLFTKLGQQASGLLGTKATGTTNSAAARPVVKRAEAQDAAAGSTYKTFHDGTRVRVRTGQQSDGSWGVRVWDSAGTLQLDETWS